MSARSTDEGFACQASRVLTEEGFACQARRAYGALAFGDVTCERLRGHDAA